MQWKHSSSPPPQKSKATITARKVMLSFFFDCRGPLLIEFLPQGSTINSAQYCSTLTKLRKAIKNKRLGLLRQGVILLHDNAHPYVSQETQRTLNTFRWDVLEHLSYSPDMSSCDFHIFRSLKRALQLKPLHSDDRVKEAVQYFLWNQPQTFYGKDIELLPKRWDLCFISHGDFF